MQSDERLCELVRSGSARAFELLIERHRGPLLRYCRGFLDPASAEDAVQQTFLKLLSAISGDRPPKRLQAWLYRVAHNQAVDLLRSKSSGHQQLDDQYDGVAQPPELVERKIELAEVVHQIGALPERQRTALVQREFEGRSLDEVALAMDASRTGVRQLVHRARINLRDALGALVPLPILRWSTESAGPTTQRVAELVSSAGPSGPGLFKLGVTAVAIGALSVGVGTSVIDSGHPDRAGRAVGSTADRSPEVLKSSGGARALHDRAALPNPGKQTPGHDLPSPVSNHRVPADGGGQGRDGDGDDQPAQGGAAGAAGGSSGEGGSAEPVSSGNVSSSQSTLAFEAADGQRNNVEFSDPGGEQIVVNETENRRIDAAGGCTSLSPSSVSCHLTGVRLLEIDTKDADDEIRIDDLRAGGRIDAGDGDDTVTIDADMGAGPDIPGVWKFAGFAVTAGDGDDHVRGGPGNDELTGGAGNDELEGRGFFDELFGGDGSDNLRGGDEADNLRGGPGNDDLSGGAMNDSLRGDTGLDRFDGGDGIDGIDSQDGGPDGTIECGGDDDYLYADPGSGDVAADDCEDVSRS